mmetsp:Transcript_7026/g.11375  ORF Transcript_7026/g.11375 Transcript_7026/m.11375 type:complete len:371 (-) Transcript_7026:652-1764(-)
MRQQPLDALAGDRGHGKDIFVTLGTGPHGFGLIPGQQIDLVPDLELHPVGAHAQIRQDRSNILRLCLSLRMRDIAHVQNDICRQNLFERRAERRHQFGGQVRDKANRIRQDHLRAILKFHPAHCGIKRGKKHVLGHHIRAGQPVEKRGFSSVGIADQRYNWIGYFGACLSVQRPGFDHFLKLTPQADELRVNGAAVGLNLRLARAADKSQTTPLPFQVGPGAHQPRALVAECRHLDLQHTLTCGGAVAENLKNKAGPVEQFDLPRLFQIPLLHGRYGAIDQHKFNISRGNACAQFLDLATAKEHASADLRQGHNLFADDFQLGQGMGQRHGFGQRECGRAPVLVGFDIRMKNPGAGELRIAPHQDASSPS